MSSSLPLLALLGVCSSMSTTVSLAKAEPRATPLTSAAAGSLVIAKRAPAGTASTPTATTPEAAETEEPLGADQTDKAADNPESTASTPAKATPAPFNLQLRMDAFPSPEARRAPRLQALSREVQNLLLLREMIETEPLVVGGLKLYLEAQPIANSQRFVDTSQLTFGIAPDRLVIYGAF